MDDKTLTALSTTLALFHIQLNALMLFVDRHLAAGTVRDDFQQLLSEGVSSKSPWLKNQGNVLAVQTTMIAYNQSQEVQ